MICVRDKKKCCGCSACAQICPKQCISLVEDKEGFLYPHVIKSECVDCGLCEKVCPIIVNKKEISSGKPLGVYAAKNNDDDTRLVSSSGGVFTPLAKRIIEDNGAVFGARFDEQWEVKHDCCYSFQELEFYRGSKYCQSRMNNSFLQVKHLLADGKKVLFSGTPCQIAGLKSYLRKDEPGLFCVDVICHGVPSPKVWREYLNNGFYKYKKFENEFFCDENSDFFKITNVRFRDKSDGWRKYRISFSVSNFSKGRESRSAIFSQVYSDDVFMKLFLNDMILRPCCYDCQFKARRSGSDITLGDYWGIENKIPSFSDDKGVSAVVLNSEKGYDLFQSIRDCLQIEKTTLEDVVSRNKAYNVSPKVHPMRCLFYWLYPYFHDFNGIAEKCLNINSGSLIWKILSVTGKR